MSTSSDSEDDKQVPTFEIFRESGGQSPQELFPARQPLLPGMFPRFIHKDRPRDILIFADGACINNGREHATAGCAFYFRPPGTTVLGHRTSGVISFRLEDTGPKGQPAAQTSNRAELRAVIGILQFRVWYGEGFQRLVIASDSEYVCLGATSWIRRWTQNGWVTGRGVPVANRDLWELLVKELLKYTKRNVTVEFWRIPREWNTVADQAAKEAATEASEPRYMKTLGAMM